MTSGEFKEIAQAMRKFGIARYKKGNIEIVASSDSQIHLPEEKPKVSVSSTGSKATEQLNLDLQDQAPAHSENLEDPVKHKVEQVQSLMKLNDLELIDKLFPDHTETEEERA